MSRFVPGTGRLGWMWGDWAWLGRTVGGETGKLLGPASLFEVFVFLIRLTCPVFSSNESISRVKMIRSTLSAEYVFMSIWS